MSNKIEKYCIETETEISIVRNRINTLFKENNHILKGEFVGSLKNDSFQGSTKYNINTTIKGKIYKDENKTIVDVVIFDTSPNYYSIINALIIVFLFISLIIIAANRNTDIIIYLIPIIIFGIAYAGLRLNLYLNSFFRVNLKKIAESISKEINGVFINKKKGAK